MTDLSIPEGYQRVMPYLILKNAVSFIGFVQTVFGATEKMKVMRDENLLMHGEVQIGESTIMVADATEQFPPQTSALFVYVSDADEAYNKALAEGATSVMAMCNQDYGRTGGITDPFGNTWWITTPVGK